MNKMRRTALSGCSLVLLSLSLPVAAQDDLPVKLGEGGLVDSREEQRHDPAQAARPIASTAARSPAVVPLTSRFILNGTPLEHGALGFVSASSLNGDKRDGALSFNASYGLGSSLTEGVQGTLFRRRQAGWYLQFHSVDRTRTITTTRQEAVDVHGTRIMLTITGGCIAPGSAPGSLCTYTPGVSEDPDLFDPDTLVPTRFDLSSRYSETISRETHEALKAPGFQRGAEGGTEIVGIDLDLPYTGATVAATRAGGNAVDRKETVQSRPMITLSRVEQNLYSNNGGASLDRTIRGFILLEHEEWSSRAFLLQAAAWFLPSYNAALQPGDADPNLRISNNLFMAANNLRLPRDSYAVFHSSKAWVPHAAAPARRASETPVAWAQGVWLGFSPVRDVRRSDRFRFAPTAGRVTLESSFVQGGFESSLGELIDGTITVIDRIDSQITEIEFSNIGDLFVQTGTDLTTQEAIRRITSQEEWRYRYVPHVSLTGTRTSGTTALRYYGGALLDKEPNAYVGFDVRHQSESGWSAYFRADAYSRPDRDYYSAVEGRLSKDISLSETGQLTLGVAANAALDRPAATGDIGQPGKGSNTVDLVALYHQDATSYSVRQRFADLGSHTDAASTSFGIRHEMTPQVTISGQVTPFSTEDSFIRAQAGLSWTLDQGQSPATLEMQWARIDYDYGRDAAGGKLGTSEDTFLAMFRTRF